MHETKLFKIIRVAKESTKFKAGIWRSVSGNFTYATDPAGYLEKFWKLQELYFVSDEPIKEGDWVYPINYGKDGFILTPAIKVGKKFKVDYRYYSEDGTTVLGKNHVEYLKIVASTDESLGLPVIPALFLMRYAECNGKITECPILLDAEFEDWYERMELKSYPNYKLKQGPNNEVVVFGNAMGRQFEDLPKTDSDILEPAPAVLRPTAETIAPALEELNYRIVKNDGKEIKALSTHKWCTERNQAISCKDKRIININIDKDYIYMTIQEDGGTRRVFTGFIETIDQLQLIDRLTKIL